MMLRFRNNKLSRIVMCTRFPVDDFRSFNSPFEVLFNFPSGYLFTIDLPSIFSHGWRLPPNLRSTPKERDSLDFRPYDIAGKYRRDFHPLWFAFQDKLTNPYIWTEIRCTPRLWNTTDSHLGLISFRSPLIRESLLVSFPPLNYMLKFSG